MIQAKLTSLRTCSHILHPSSLLWFLSPVYIYSGIQSWTPRLPPLMFAGVVCRGQ